ncbi:MAG TPA: HAD-IG family 5'-nucleotidase [Candidatus Dormibacteraeota bacterium]|nr:HAD-IG family 5'-nucleotidase [Candidatus Dormibacteraeota bacterium]
MAVTKSSPNEQDPSVKALRYREHRIPRRHRVFVNRNLRLSKIRAIGFDLDHTLAHYDPIPVEELAFDLSKQKLVKSKNYPREILDLKYDPTFVIRGLVVDKKRGNLLKMDYFNFVSRGHHGLRELRSEERERAYRSSRIRLSHENYSSVDTLFHLPEVYLFLCVVGLLERAGEKRSDYTQAYDDVREMIDEAHRDGSLKSVITANLDRYIRLDTEMRTVLEEFRRGGKKLFLLTNSDWAYADALLRHLLERGRGAPSHWSEIFDLVVVEAKKPSFFAANAPPEAVPEAVALPTAIRIVRGANGSYLEKTLGAGGDEILYFGDHTYGDILLSKKALGWRTAMLVPELDREIRVTQDHSRDFDRLSRLSAERHHLEIDKAALGRELRRLALLQGETDGTDPARRAEIAARLQSIPEEIKHIEQRSVEMDPEIEELRMKIDRAYNPYWGSIFREGNESSRFGHQLKDFACLYTSRVSNFLHYPMNYYFQSPIGYMPHDI